MARGDQLGRQWRIIQTLISSRAGKSVSDLSDTLECHPRTVYRDLEALEKAGFPVYTDRDGGKNIWSILDSAKLQIPIPLNLAELMALYFSRNMLKVLKDTVFHDALESLFKKIKSTLPTDYTESLDRMERSLHVGERPYKRYTDLEHLISAVQEAITENRYIYILYYALSRKAESQRCIAPYKVWYLDGTFYLIAYCTLRKDTRIFALDRIKDLKLMNDHFEPPAPEAVDQLMKSSFGVFRGDAVTVKILFSPRVAEYIREKVWHETQELNTHQDGSVCFTAEVAGTDEIRFWLLQWGADAQVLQPESLKAEVKAEAKKMMALYSRI